MRPSPQEFVLGPDARLVLDAEGLRLRRLPPALDFGGSWSDLYAVAVQPVDGVSLVSVTFVDGLQGLAGKRGDAATRFFLPSSPDYPPENLVAAIELFRRGHEAHKHEAGP